MYTLVFCRVRKASNATDSKALWYKMQQNGISKTVVECMKRTKDKIQCCVKWSYEEVNETVKQATGVRQTCSLGPYLFTIFTDLLSGANCTMCVYVQMVLQPILVEKTHKYKQWKSQLYWHYSLLMILQ
jgi:F0F1-type ATP synthase membrane subunit a